MTVLANRSHLYDQLSAPIWQEFDRLFDSFFGNKDILGRVKQTTGYPRLEIATTGNQFRVMASVPGTPKENLVIERDGEVVTISGESCSSKCDDGTTYHVRELVKSKFSRSFTLPAGVKYEEEPITQLKDGILLLIWNYTPGESPPKTKRIQLN
jgi:HSP20 family protein